MEVPLAMIHTTTPTEAVPFPVDPELTPGALMITLAPRAERVSLFREMLGALEEATPGGQRYLMTKLVALFRREFDRPGVSFTPWQRAITGRVLAGLEVELARMAPDAAVFEHRGQMIVDVIALA
jgi:hypothetical protein